MELHEEIEEIFDKFQGGYYCYSDTEKNVELIVETDYYLDDARIMITDKDMDLHASIELRNGNPHIVYSKNKQCVEGSWELAAPFVIKNVQQILVDYKHYFEENGFDADNYDEKMCSAYGNAEVDVLYIDNMEKLDDFEKGHLKKLDDMKRIVNEDVKLFWVD